MKNYPEILYPHQAKQFTDNEETALLEAIVSVNDQLRLYDGHPILISIPAHTKRVRAELIERISGKRWIVKVTDENEKREHAPSQVNGAVYRAGQYNYNEESEAVITLTENRGDSRI